MAYRTNNIVPIDLQPQVAVGISLPFNGTIGFNSTYTTLEQIKTNLLSFLLTNKGERLFQPTYGSNLRKLIFEQNDDITISGIKDILTSQVENQFNNLKVLKIDINTDVNSNSIEIFISYQIINTNITDVVVINFE